VVRAALAQPDAASVDQTHTVRHGDMLSVVTEDRCNSLCMLQFEKAHVSAQFPNIFCKKNVSTDQQQKPQIKTRMLFGRSRIDELVLLLLLDTHSASLIVLEQSVCDHVLGLVVPVLVSSSRSCSVRCGLFLLVQARARSNLLGMRSHDVRRRGDLLQAGCESEVACTREWVREGM
jgi:hypothetical protein